MVVTLRGGGKGGGRGGGGGGGGGPAGGEERGGVAGTRSTIRHPRKALGQVGRHFWVRFST